jgi:hypothetical protein
VYIISYQLIEQARSKQVQQQEDDDKATID